MKAAVLERIGQLLSIVDIPLPLPPLFRGQVCVEMLVAGICGSQLDEISGYKGNPDHLPHLLGHEGCGKVEAVGTGVNNVAPADTVIVHWRKGEGIESNPPVFGKIKAGPCTTFSEFTIVSENRVTRITDDVPVDFAVLLGCALSTALAVVENVGTIKTALVVGCGGVGLSLILAAKAQGAEVTAIDISDKRDLVESLGATFYQSWLISGCGQEFDVIFDTIGKCHFGHKLAPNGTYVVLGQTDELNMYLPNFFKGEGQIIKSTQGGGFNPSKDIPRYIAMWRDGYLDDYKKIITHRISLDQINEGIQFMRDGKAGRVMIEMK